MKTRFYIEKRKDESGKLMEGERPVFMSISFSGNRVILGAGIKVDMHGWDIDLQKVKATYPGSYAYNEWLATLNATAESTLNAVNSNNENLDSESFRKMFNQLKPKFSSGYFDVFYQFMDSNSLRWSDATYHKVRTMYKLLREFEDQTGYLITFNSMTAVFLEQFMVFSSGKGYKYSTTYKSINILVWFLNWATDNNFNVYREYRGFYKHMKPLEEVPKNHLYLRWNELMMLKEYNPANRREERVRDLFCFMCYSGIRFAELQRLRKEDLGRDQVIIKKKQGNTRQLPLNKYTREIYQKYENKYYLDNAAFPSISVITMNKYLRSIGKELGLNRLVTSPGEMGERTFLHEFLTVGIAVNTFIANALELKVPMEVISNFTGVQNDSRAKKIRSTLAGEEIKKFDQI